MAFARGSSSLICGLTEKGRDQILFRPGFLPQFPIIRDLVGVLRTQHESAQAHTTCASSTQLDPDSRGTARSDTGRDHPCDSSHADHRFDDPGPAAECSPRTWRRTTRAVEECRDEGAIDGTGGGEGIRSTTTHSPSGDRADDLGDSSQPGLEEESVHAGVLHFGLGTDAHRLRDDDDTTEAGHGEDLCHLTAGRSGPHGVRHSCQSNLCRSEADLPRLLPVGKDNGPRGPTLSPSGALCEVARDDSQGVQEQAQLHDTGGESQDGGCETGADGSRGHSKRELSGLHTGSDEGPEYDNGNDDADGRTERGHGGIASRTASEESRGQHRGLLQHGLQVEDPPVMAEGSGGTVESQMSVNRNHRRIPET